MQQHKGICSKASSAATNAVGSGSAELILEESVNISKVLGKHKAVETVSKTDRDTRTPEIKPQKDSTLSSAAGERTDSFDWEP